MIGTKLGRYEILEVLGRGGQSIAYKARDPKIDRIVAIKQILSQKGQPEAARADFLTRFMRESQSAGRLSHPNIATIYDVGGDEEGEPYIAMEYVDGCNLDDLVAREHPLSQTRILRLFIQLCNALDYAHNAGIVHRDIKPGNIMLTRDDKLKVVDFGIARMDSSSLTQAGMVMGTPSYMSPEQIMGKSVDRRSDIFSLGVVLYEMLTGQKPFKGEHATSVIYKIVNDRHASVLEHEREPTLLPDFDPILDKVLAKNPADRYQTCAELGLILERLLQDAQLAPASAHERSATLPTPRETADAADSSQSIQDSGEALGSSPSAVVSLERGRGPRSERARNSDAPTAFTGGPHSTSAPIPPSRERPEEDAENPEDWSFTISNVGPPSGRTPAVPSSASPLLPRDSYGSDASRTEAVPLNGDAPEPARANTASRSVEDSTDAALPRGRRGWMLPVGAAVAVIVIVALVVLTRIPGGTAPPPPAAAVEVKPVPDAPTSAVAELLRNAREALSQGLVVGRDGKDALHFVTAVLSLDPDNTEARALEAEIRTRALQQVDELAKRGKTGEVEAALDMLLEDFPDDVEILTKLEAAQAAQSRTQAAGDLDRAKLAGEKAFATGNYAEAVRQFGRLTKADPRNAAAFYSLGRSNFARNELTEATKNLTRACKLEPRNPTYNIQLSRVLEKSGNLRGALHHLEKGFELGGDREHSTTALSAHSSELKFRIDLAEVTPHTFKSRHVHRFVGRCEGQLVVTESGINFIPDEEKEHAVQAPWAEVKSFAVVKNRLEVELTRDRNLAFECTELDWLKRIAAVLSRPH
ncbi:MAG: protein kinase domain-containing protein [Thermoanaerobaculia bacterium]